jgi:hypothetical protein
MRNKAQKRIDNRETDKSLFSQIDPEYRDQKAVRIAISKMVEGRFELSRAEEK